MAAIETWNSTDIPTFRGLEGLFANVLSSILALGGIVLFLVLVFGGIQYITAGGEPPKIEAARKTLTYAIFGIVLLAVSFLILVFIDQFTGANILTFRVFQ